MGELPVYPGTHEWATHINNQYIIAQIRLEQNNVKLAMEMAKNALGACNARVLEYKQYLSTQGAQQALTYWKATLEEYEARAARAQELWDIMVGLRDNLGAALTKIKQVSHLEQIIQACVEKGQTTAELAEELWATARSSAPAVKAGAGAGLGTAANALSSSAAAVAPTVPDAATAAATATTVPDAAVTSVGSTAAAEGTAAVGETAAVVEGGLTSATAPAAAAGGSAEVAGGAGAAGGIGLGGGLGAVLVGGAVIGVLALIVAGLLLSPGGSDTGQAGIESTATAFPQIVTTGAIPLTPAVEVPPIMSAVSPSPPPVMSAVSPSPSPSPTSNPALDKPYSSPQYAIHVIARSANPGRTEDTWMLYSQAPTGNTLLVPDGEGGTVALTTDSFAGPFNTPRDLCAGAAAAALKLGLNCG